MIRPRAITASAASGKPNQLWIGIIDPQGKKDFDGENKSHCPQSLRRDVIPMIRLPHPKPLAIMYLYL